MHPREDCTFSGLNKEVHLLLWIFSKGGVLMNYYKLLLSLTSSRCKRALARRPSTASDLRALPSANRDDELPPRMKGKYSRQQSGYGDAKPPPCREHGGER